MYGYFAYGQAAYGESAITQGSTPVVTDPDPNPNPNPGTGPTPVPIPINAPNIYAATIMRRSVINISVALGPASINLTVRLP